MKAFLIVLLVGLCTAFLQAEPREWTEQATGRKITAEFVSLDGDQVTLLLNGREVKLPVARLSEADQSYLKIVGTVPAPASEPVATEKAANPTTATSKIIGPIETEGSNYFYYVPTSLKPGKKAPLIFYTSSGGGSAGTVKKMIEGAEICGWIAACSVESRNSKDESMNSVHSERCVKHLIATQPVDPKRLYFTGNSGGARIAYKNSKRQNGAGVLAIIAGGQEDELTKSKHYFMITGSTDYNRYDVSNSFAALRKTSALRFHPGRHEDGPDWLVTEGIVWLETAWHQKAATPAAERADFDSAATTWVENLKSSAPHRASWWADFFSTRMTGPPQKKMSGMSAELAGSPENAAYLKGLVALEDFADSVLAPEGPYYQPGHTTPEIQRKAAKIAADHGDSPWIKEIAAELQKPVIAAGK